MMAVWPQYQLGLSDSSIDRNIEPGCDVSPDLDLFWQIVC